MVDERHQCRVVLIARGQEKAKTTLVELEEAGIEGAVHLADFSRPREVLAAGRAVAASERELHVAMLNAGTWVPGKERELQEDGLELHYTVNFLQTVLLVEELLPLMTKSAPARSGLHRHIP